MARVNSGLIAFNRGIISPKSFARVDLDRVRLSADRFNNWIAKTTGAMTIRPGTKYFGSSIRDTGAAWVEFVAAADAVALLELTDLKMRAWLGVENQVQGETVVATSNAHGVSLLTRPAVDTTVSISDTGWEVASVGGGTSTSGGTLNAGAIGSIARKKKRVIVSDTGTEHSLAITITRGPVTLRVGSTDSGDQYISETDLGTGYHNLAFTPTGNFHIMLQNDANVDRIVGSIAIGGSGVVEITTPWDATNLDDIRYDQSADVVFLDCDDVRPQKIERRGTGRSWSVVDYAPNNGPFLPTRSGSAKLTVAAMYGNTTLTSNIPVFTSDHVGSLVRMFHNGQSGQWKLGLLDAYSDAIEMTGISDTGTPGSDSERRIIFSVTGTYTGGITIERSIDGKNIGFKPSPSQFKTSPVDTGYATDTGTFSVTIDDPDDNLKVWYRAKVTSYTSGVATVNATYGGGGVTGMGRITAFSTSKSVSFEVIKRFSSTGASDNWQFGFWSTERGFPTAVALHGGRLYHAEGGSLFGSVADDYENFDEETIGDAGPIIRTLGSGPVDNIEAIISLLRLIIHTAGAELALRSSSIDEPVTPSNSSAGTFSTNGSAPVRAVKLDNRGIFVQRSRRNLFMIGPDNQSPLGDYGAFDLTLLVPDLLEAGVTSIAIQRQPDTRIHCVLADGTVAILTYEPQEEVVCWTTWSTDGTVEKAMVLPGVSEDAVYYHIRREPGNGNDSRTKVLLTMNGIDAGTTFLDTNAGGSSHTWTAAGNAQNDSAQVKFGTTSGLFDGTGDYISTPDHDDFRLGNGDFTVDCWFNCNLASGTEGRICGQTDASQTAAGSSFYIRKTTSNVISASIYDGAGETQVTGTTTFTATGWHHLALVRTSNTLKLFIDGVQEGGNVSFSGTVPDSSGAFAVGTRGGGSTLSPWNGWIDEFRLSVGVARWTTTFTPPTAAYSSTTRRFLEKWALESECVGDTGLTWIMDCAASYTDTGRTATLTNIVTHLPSTNVIVWSDDTGSIPGVDRSPDVNGVQTTYAVDTGGDVTLSVAVHHAVAGLPFSALWKSTKLAYGAQMGTALAQQKRVPQTGLILYKTHINGLFVGTDTGSPDPLPRVIDGAVVDQDHIFETLDKVAFPTPGTWATDPRFVLEGKAPRPATVLAAIPTVVTAER